MLASMAAAPTAPIRAAVGMTAKAPAACWVTLAGRRVVVGMMPDVKGRPLSGLAPAKLGAGVARETSGCAVVASGFRTLAAG